jgi:hypothetical protein
MNMVDLCPILHLDQSKGVSEWLLFNANSAFFSYIMARTS